MSYNFNTAPYYDDYDANNRFLKILFNPGRAVQARELTQIQSILQNQVASGANHIWKDGANVLGGEVSINHRDWIQLASADTSWLNRVVYGTTSNAVAVIEQLHSDETQPIYYFRTLSGTFADTEALATYDTVCNGGQDEFGGCLDNSWYDNSLTVLNGSIVAKGKALEAKIGNGIYWIDDNFIPVLAQTIFLDDNSATPTCKVGFDIEETIVASTTDASLLDPASGFYNQNAPGADRYRITLNLVKETDSLEANKWVWLMDVENGAITTQYERTDYSLLANEIARRTHDESGNYTLNPFPLELKNNLTDDSLYNIKVEPSKAYISGYEHELLVPVEVSANKSRSTKAVANDHITPEFGPYFEVESENDFHGVFDVLHKEYVIFVTNSDYTTAMATPDTIGVAKRITHVTMVGTTFRIYLENDEGLDAISPARFIVSQTDPSVYAKLHIPTGVAVRKGVNKPWLYELTDVVSSVTSGQVTFSTQKNFTAQMTGSRIDVPAGPVGLHFERILYIYNSTSGNIVPKAGTTSTSTVFWTEDLSGNDSALITIVNSSGVEVTDLNGDFLHIMSDMYQSDAVWRSISENDTTGTFTLLNEVLTIPHGVQNIISVIAPDTTDVTSSFTFDDGVTDTTYKDGTLTWTDTVNASQPGTYTVTFKAHTFGDIATATYFTVNSRTTAGINYSNIGVYQGDINQKVYRLSDCLDFRTSDEDYLTGTYLPLPESNISCSYEFYLPRKDRLTIDDDGIINIKEGFPSEDPILPTELDNEMTLYELYVPPYTYDAKNINVTHVKNKRYTMQDIRALDERLNNLEYYTALNLLEQDTAAMQVTDELGFERYKNGILVDPFHDHGIGDITNDEYYVSIFPEAGICTTPFTMTGLDFESGTMNGMKQNNLTYTLDFNVIEGWISQNNGSQVINLNPFARKSWVGFVTISPSTDTWFEELYVPDVIVQNENNNSVTQQRIDYGTQTRWNAWQTTWNGWRDTGGRENASGSEVISSSGNDWQWSTGTWSTRRSGITRQRRIWREIQTRGASWDQRQVQQTNQVRTGERSWIMTNDIRSEVSDLVIDTSAIEWMRSKDITIEAHKLKPNTQMHFRFDGVDVDNYVAPSGGAYAEPVVTDAYGKLENVKFTIPSEGGVDGVRFRTGSKVLEVMDSFDSNMTTQGNAVFTSAGTLKTREKTILSTLENVTVTENLTQNQTLSGGTRTVRRGGQVTTTSESRTVTEWYDPVSESFLVTDSDGGVFVDSIDLYFWSKDAEGTPVRVEIRPMENGYPTPTEIPMASVMLYPDDVVTSNDGSANTRFQFADPIYLMNNTEYCFVVISDSLNYNIFISELGEVDLITGDRISSQPYLGSMFTSQNNTTWTPEQNKDIKFRINKCSFDTGTEGTIQINMKGFEGTKKVTSFTPSFAPMTLQGTDVTLEAIINGDTNNTITGVVDREDVVLEQQVTLDGSHTIDAGYQYTPISYIAKYTSSNSNISPVINAERMSTVVQNNVISDDDVLLKNQKGIYVSKFVQLANPAEDLIMWLSIQEVPNTYVKVFYDTGKVIPRYIDIIPYTNTITHGDFDVNDFEEEYSYIYPAGTFSPENIITNQNAPQNNWNGVIGATGSGSTHVSTAYVDGDDEPTNLTRMHLVDMSNMKGIKQGCFISRYDLDGVTHDITSSGVGTDISNYEVDDIWFGTWDDDLDRKFWRKVLLPNGTFSKEPVPILYIDSIVDADHEDYGSGLAVIEEEPIEWREMKDSGVSISNSTVVTNMEFIEHTFKPLKKVVDEFDSFRIKIELHTTNPCYLPAVRELRVLAMT